MMILQVRSQRQRNIDFAVDYQMLNRRSGLFDDAHSDARETTPKPLQQPWQVITHEWRYCADRYFSGHRIRTHGQGIFSRGNCIEYEVAMAQEFVARMCECHATGMPPEQHGTEMRPQALNRLGKGGRRDVEGLHRSRDGTSLGNGIEVLQGTNRYTHLIMMPVSYRAMSPDSPIVATCDNALCGLP